MLRKYKSTKNNVYVHVLSCCVEDYVRIVQNMMFGKVLSVDEIHGSYDFGLEHFVL